MNQPRTDQALGNILIVDDTPDNLRVLSQLLTREGYQVRAVTSGQMALTVVQAAPPEIILLDIRMPQMDGFEVARTLKADLHTQSIPIIFISASDDVSDKVQAFEVGGVDYVTKPFQMAEVLARVKTHLTLSRLQQTLAEQNTRLEQAENKYRSIFENCLEGIFQVSPDGTYWSANPALASIYGYASTEDFLTAVNTRSQSIYARPDRRLELQVFLQQYGQISNFESEARHREGHTIWISENVRAVKDESGKILYYEGTLQDITERRHMEAELRKQRMEADRLLLSILPSPIAEQLKRKKTTIADHFSDVTVMFADLVNFTAMSKRMNATDLVELLNQIFSTFDHLADLHGLEKIKTIGDEYMVAGGIPDFRFDHVQAIANMALDMQQEVQHFQSDLGEPFQLRVGIHTGSVIAGVIGKRKFTYDLWGDTVNLASRMESQGLPGRIQVTQDVYKRLHNQYDFEERGSLDVRGIGEMTTYWLLGRKF